MRNVAVNRPPAAEDRGEEIVANLRAVVDVRHADVTGQLTGINQALVNLTTATDHQQRVLATLPSAEAQQQQRVADLGALRQELGAVLREGRDDLRRDVLAEVRRAPAQIFVRREPQQQQAQQPPVAEAAAIPEAPQAPRGKAAKAPPRPAAKNPPAQPAAPPAAPQQPAEEEEEDAEDLAQLSVQMSRGSQQPSDAVRFHDDSDGDLPLDAFDVWDSRTYATSKRRTLDIANDLRVATEYNSASSYWLGRHFTAVSQSIERYYRTPNPDSRRMLQTQLDLMRETFMNGQGVTPQEIELRVMKLRDSNKNERQSVLVGRAFKELKAEKGRNNPKSSRRQGRNRQRNSNAAGKDGGSRNSGSRNNSRGRGDARPPAGNGPRGAQQQ